MKYIKTYETLKLLNLTDHSIWIIYGNIEKQCNVLKMLKNRISKNRELVKDLELVIKELEKDNDAKKSIGCILSYTDKIFFYYTFDGNDEKKSAISGIYNKYTLKGELKIENNKIVLDTIELEIDKYNL